MLNSINLNDKTYPELLAEAIAQIPLYSREWTNFNPSDPGITLLENMTAFHLVHQETINDVPEEIQRKLLQLLGCFSAENQAAELLVQSPIEGGGILPSGHLLWSGSIPFETTETVPLQPWGLGAVYACTQGAYRDLTWLLSGGGSVFPFGREPKEGDGFLCILTGTPEVGEPIRLWLQVQEEELRTPFGNSGEIPTFSQVRWQYYTKEGWCDARFTDETMGLLRSGAVTLWLEGELPAVFEETAEQGCALRCLLSHADYDRVPRLQSLSAHLFPVRQQYTSVRCLTFPGSETIEVQDPLFLLGNFLVFGKETPEGPYYFYKQSSQSGRCYQVEESQWSVRLTFDEAHCPCSSPDGVRVICYDNEMIHHRLLGQVCGYDHQVMPVDLVQQVLEESFLVALEVPQDSGENAYYFLAPGETGPEGISYHLRSQEAQVVIDEPGLGGYNLLLAHCAVTQGSRGNVRAGTVLEQRGGYDGTEVLQQYHCPAPGRFGSTYEGIEALRSQFSKEFRKTTVAVRCEDYEHLVHQVPGLCIHKVKAVAFEKKNLVKLAIKPYTEERFPKLSADYLRQIRDYLDPRRMLTTRFELCQPRYVAVGVQVSLSIRGMESYAREQVEQLLRQMLDYVNGPQNFGSWIRFHDFYQRLVALPFVETVDELNLFPEHQGASLVGSDIRLEDDSLAYPGTIHLTLRTHGR